MTNIKTLVLAAATALSLGAASAMAQESAGGVGSGPFETFELQDALRGYNFARPLSGQPEAGSSDVDQYRAPAHPAQTLIGADGNA